MRSPSLNIVFDYSNHLVHDSPIKEGKLAKSYKHKISFKKS